MLTDMLGQGTTMDWSSDGRWTGTHPTMLGSGTRTAGAAVQGANRRGALISAQKVLF